LGRKFQQHRVNARPPSIVLFNARLKTTPDTLLFVANLKRKEDLLKKVGKYV